MPRGAKKHWVRSNTAAQTPSSVQVYYDISGGMRGYATGSRVFGNLATITDNFSRSGLFEDGQKANVELRTFGEYEFDAAAPEAPTAATPEAIASPSTYNEADTQIAELLDWVRHSHEQAKDGSKPLSVIVTDLMEDDDGAVADSSATVGGKLRNLMIESGLAVGVLGVKVRFDGTVYVVGSDGRDRPFTADMRTRPLIILMVGDPYHVRSYYQYLRSTNDLQPFSEDTPVANHAFAVFGLEASEMVTGSLSRSGIDSGFSPTTASTALPPKVAKSRLTTFAFASSTDEEAEGGLKIALQADADVKPFEVIGNQPTWRSQIWQLLDENCEGGAGWSPRGRLPPRAVEEDGQELSFLLNAATVEQLALEKGIYLIQVEAGQKGLVEDHPGAAWMREWSMSNASIAQSLGGSRSRPIGTPGLEPLRRNLLNELLLPGNETIWRSGAQFIVKVE